MTTEATKSLVTALEKNKVVHCLYYCNLLFFFVKQTLTRLFIEHNQMTEDAVQSLVNALKHNKVILFHIDYLYRLC